MCECLCGEVRGETNFRLNEDVVSVDIYPGCRDCSELIGVDIRIFNKKGAEDWLGGAEIEDAVGNEYGWLPTFKSIPIISVSALADAVREEYGEDYAEWIESCGLGLLQKAMRLTQKEYN
jgi:hypothetical protein